MRRAALTAAVLVATSVVAPGQPASAVSTDQSYWVPVDKKVVVVGHGYGHGHGMSQHGAQGAALQGLTYERIVGFYYPGTSWSKVTGKVRVLITADTTDDVVVSPAAGLAVRDLANGSAYPLPVREAVSRWRLNVRKGRTVVEMLTDRWRLFGATWARSLAGDAEFLATDPITLWTPSGPRDYRGTLRAASPVPGGAARDTVNVVSMDQYVMGVVPYEMPASWHAEAVKAQSVAARTYATWSRNQNLRRHYQICDTTSCQVYGGYSAEHPATNAAIASTRKQVLTYDGAPAFTQFSSSNGGWTSAGFVPYLVAQEDPYDGWSDNPNHNWSISMTDATIEKAWPAIGNLTAIAFSGREGNGEWGGRIDLVTLTGEKGTKTVSAVDFRATLGLKSEWINLTVAPLRTR